MKDNKNQQSIAGANNAANAASKSQQNGQLNNYATASTYKNYESSQPVIRRYAIDDHGGGYQGL
jgi:hypothetical protein